ncbi:hypothetical protein BDR07DRAFT_1309453 [Suillus spraguei]|nr:hypothetical protein BDR07DRAFT_1309453 [Suillus spraguei]
MGKQEMLHQQIMSYLVGSGNHYSSHAFRMFRWFEFINAFHSIEGSDLLLSDEDQAEHKTVVKEHAVNILPNKIEFSSDVMDYSCRPFDETFTDLCLWDFMENTVKKKEV